MKKNTIICAAIACLLIGVGTSSCARFKVENLEPTKIATIPLNKPNGLNYSKQQGVYHGVPGRVGVSRNQVIIAEPSNHQIKIFENSELKRTIVSGSYYSSAEERTTLREETPNEVSIHFIDGLQVPGRIVAGNQQDFYVENFSALDEEEQKDNRGFYKLLHFNLEGKYLGLIGRKGQPELPFENILWFDVDAKNRLWVFYRYLGQVQLDQYKDRRLNKTITGDQCAEVLFANNTEEKLIKRCEFMYPFYDSNKVLMVGRVDREPEKKEDTVDAHIFQHRVFKTSNLELNSTTTIFAQLNDPEDFPYLPYDEKHIMLWQTLNPSEVKFSIYNLKGSLVNNLQISLTERFQKWRKTYADLSGRLYSIKLADSQFHLLRWQ